MSSNNDTLKIIPEFWFCKPQPVLTVEEKLNKLCEDPEIKKRFDKLICCLVLSQSDNPVQIFGYGTEIWKIYDDIDYIENEHANKYGRPVCYPPRYFMKGFYDMANYLCRKFDGDYEQELHMSENETVNGYKLYNTQNGKSILRRQDYEKCVEMWKNNKQYTHEEFMQLYDEGACSDWAKIDAHGESYGGYWKYPDGSPGKQNAWHLTRKENGEALWNLPYPKEVIFETIEIGCGNRMESVRYTNFLCEWIKRKMEQLGQLKINKTNEIKETNGDIEIIIDI